MELKNEFVRAYIVYKVKLNIKTGKVAVTLIIFLDCVDSVLQNFQ